MKNKWKELKIGEKVILYCISKSGENIKKVRAIVTNEKMAFDVVEVEMENGTTHIVWRGRIRKLKPKEQKIKLSRKQIAEAWDKVFGFDIRQNLYIHSFNNFLRELGFKDE